MNYEWVDVTGECEIKMVGGGYLKIYHRDKDNNRGYVYNRDTGLLYSDWRCSWIGYDHIRIERHVEVKPEFKWTPETVAAIDWSEKSEIETTECSFEHWDEQIERAKKTGAFPPFDDALSNGDCPNCKKYRTNKLVTDDCRDCILQGISGSSGTCCNGLYAEFANNRNLETATAVRDFIKTKLDELEKAAKWEPKIRDWIRIASGSRWQIAAIDPRTAYTYLIIDPKTHKYDRVNRQGISLDTGGSKCDSQK